MKLTTGPRPVKPDSRPLPEIYVKWRNGEQESLKVLKSTGGLCYLVSKDGILSYARILEEEMSKDIALKLPELVQKLQSSLGPLLSPNEVPRCELDICKLYKFKEGMKPDKFFYLVGSQVRRAAINMAVDHLPIVEGFFRNNTFVAGSSGGQDEVLKKINFKHDFEYRLYFPVLRPVPNTSDGQTDKVFAPKDNANMALGFEHRTLHVFKDMACSEIKYIIRDELKRLIKQQGATQNTSGTAFKVYKLDDFLQKHTNTIVIPHGHQPIQINADEVFASDSGNKGTIAQSSSNLCGDHSFVIDYTTDFSRTRLFSDREYFRARNPSSFETNTLKQHRITSSFTLRPRVNSLAAKPRITSPNSLFLSSTSTTDSVLVAPRKFNALELLGESSDRSAPETSSARNIYVRVSPEKTRVLNSIVAEDDLSTAEHAKSPDREQLDPESDSIEIVPSGHKKVEPGDGFSKHDSSHNYAALRRQLEEKGLRSTERHQDNSIASKLEPSRQDVLDDQASTAVNEEPKSEKSQTELTKSFTIKDTKGQVWSGSLQISNGTVHATTLHPSPTMGTHHKVTASEDSRRAKRESEIYSMHNRDDQYRVQMLSGVSAAPENRDNLRNLFGRSHPFTEEDGAPPQSSKERDFGPVLANALDEEPPNQQDPSNQTQDKGPLGIRNLGNTCYSNSVIQVIARLKAFQLQFEKVVEGSKGRHEKHIVNIGDVSDEIFKLIHLNRTRTPTTRFDPTRLKEVLDEKAPQFRGYYQQDAHEFLLKVLDLLNQEANSLSGIQDVYPVNSDYSQNCRYIRRGNSELLCSIMGLIETSLQCDSCKKRTITFEPYTVLSLSLTPPKIRSTSSQDGEHSKSRTSPLRLDELIQNCVCTEELEEDDWVRCETCHNKSCKWRQNRLVSEPDTLIIHLKRFIARQNESGYSFIKNPKPVTFEELLDLGPYVSEPHSVELANQAELESSSSERDMMLSRVTTKVKRSIPYRLKAVINHTGGLQSGHYYSYIREGEDWQEFNDEKVTPMEGEKAYCTRLAYILVYEKCPSLLVSSQSH